MNIRKKKYESLPRGIQAGPFTCISRFTPSKFSFFSSLGSSLFESMLRFNRSSNFQEILDKLSMLLYKMESPEYTNCPIHEFLDKFFSMCSSNSRIEFTRYLERDASLLTQVMKLITQQICPHLRNKIHMNQDLDLMDYRTILKRFSNELQINILLMSSELEYFGKFNGKLLVCLYLDESMTFSVLYAASFLVATYNTELPDISPDEFPFVYTSQTSLATNIGVDLLDRDLRSTNESEMSSRHDSFQMYPRIIKTQYDTPRRHQNHSYINRAQISSAALSSQVPTEMERPQIDSQTDRPQFYPQIIRADRSAQGTKPCDECGDNRKNFSIECKNHSLCDTCRVHDVMFGLNSCRVCKRKYNEVEYDLLQSFGMARYNKCIFELGLFQCYRCGVKIPNHLKKRPGLCDTCLSIEGERCPEEESLKDSECVICTDECKDPFVTPCNHVFCKNCAFEWFYKNKRCPMCNRDIEVSEIKRYDMNGIDTGEDNQCTKDIKELNGYNNPIRHGQRQEEIKEDPNLIQEELKDQKNRERGCDEDIVHAYLINLLSWKILRPDVTISDIRVKLKNCRKNWKYRIIDQLIQKLQ